jgi:hypothetical protein
VNEATEHQHPARGGCSASRRRVSGPEKAQDSACRRRAREAAAARRHHRRARGAAITVKEGRDPLLWRCAVVHSHIVCVDYPRFSRAPFRQALVSSTI